MLNRTTNLILAASLFLLLYACSTKTNTIDPNDGVATLNADSLKKHIAMLASDAFMGRKPFTEGEKLTIEYLQQQFAAVGLEPGNGNSYLQEVPLVNIIANADLTMDIKTQKNNFQLHAPDEYILWTNKTDSVITIDASEIVFAGYGVVAPEQNWNDYAGVDVKDKIVLVMVNDPGFWAGDTTIFKGKEMTYYGRWTYKFEEAARQGAKACLVIHNAKAAGYPFAVVQNSFNTSRLQLNNKNNTEENCDALGWITEDAAKKLFVSAGLDSTLLIEANKPGFTAKPLNISATTSMTITTETNVSHNVIGKITGSKYSDEVIIYSAHWDHFGIGKPDANGDSIYNGALDNATGTAALIELARAFKSLQSPPERTIVMLAVTAEEQGLLGSAYYASNPVYPVNKTIANINMDGLNRFTKTMDVVIIGQGQTTMEEVVKEIVEQQGRYLAYDPHPEAGYYFRSDHFSFAKVGIPALYAGDGIDVAGKGKEFGQALEDAYRANDYHKPSDNYDAATWTLDGAITDMIMYFQLGKKISSAEKWPEWKEGSEFKKIRENN